ncbi:hypothetical protein MTO96_019199 [Rhipicephalus appendiculatus]
MGVARVKREGSCQFGRAVGNGLMATECRKATRPITHQVGDTFGVAAGVTTFSACDKAPAEAGAGQNTPGERDWHFTTERSTAGVHNTRRNSRDVRGHFHARRARDCVLLFPLPELPAAVVGSSSENDLRCAREERG